MRELRNILELYDRGDTAALVTLVRVEGSSYRRPGARLLIAANGEYAGGVSGGCLEAEVIRKAQWKIRDGAVVDRYSTLFDDTAEIPYGLGCGGTVDLLLEPTNTPEFAALMEAMRASLRGERRQVATQLPEDGVAFVRCILDDAGQHVFRSDLRLVDPAQRMFLETLDPPQRLVIFGAGDDVQPMVKLAALLGWSVTVLDGRSQWARRERFPEAEEILVLPAAFTVSSRDAVVIMTHSYEQDREALATILPHRPRYLGLLGSRHRSALLVAEAAALLGISVEEACEGLFAPIGLDLGGDGAEVIALATIAEIQASLESKIGAPRRMTPEIVAEQIAEGGASRYLQVQCAL